MSAKNNGGPAFPEKRRVRRAGYDTNEFEPVGGMTLRDYFAAKALQGTLAFAGPHIPGSGQTPEFLAKTMYEIADAMLAAREAS